MNKKRLTFLISAIIVLVFTTVCFLAGSSFSSTTGKAAGTTVVQPKNPVNSATCLTNCHATVKMLYTRGGHKNLNCASCHEISAKHAANPSEKTRPKTNFSHESCGQCHVNEFQSMYSSKYHDMWTKKEPNINYMIWADPGSTLFSRVQGRMPRYHVSLLYDLAVNRTGGRFEFKNGLYGWNTIGGKLWDNVYDAHPGDGNEIKTYVPRTAFRPPKGGPNFSSPMCMTCKTAEQILDWPYMGVPSEKARFNRTTASYEVLRAVNYGVTCNLCHDPHSAEPRVVRDSFIRALTDTEFKDNVYQSDPQKTKIEVINMGERGFVRKIAILEKYDSKLQCGQCHCATDNLGEFDVKTGKFIASKEVDGMNITPMMGPFEYLDFYQKRGWYNGGIHPATGARVITASHPNVELVTLSKHGKAGLGCTDCHYARETDQKTKKSYKSHQVSFPTYKIQQTCLNAGCHGKGSKQNWTEEKALYNIKIVQHLQRKRLVELELQLERLMAGIIAAQRMGNIDKSVIVKAQDAQTKAFAMQNYWAIDYSNGIHNPELSEKSLTKTLLEVSASYEELNKALKEKGTAK
ncbi:MAG TPA: ammonia-forming cytochrome c nitrite reductase subunit c552 [Nitrospirota bacterium]|nr:ammonia-forming cytochrome c nitrite reductase subunit c552 [Nitrospirota bacterium]